MADKTAGQDEMVKPLLDGSEEQLLSGVDRQKPKKPRFGYVSADKWTNSQVLQWLIEIDQKTFLPAALAHNISGATLLQLSQEEFKELGKICCKEQAPGAFALRSLFNHVQSLKGTTEVIQEQYGTDPQNDATFGRLIQHASGWTYDREYNEWVDYLEVHNENAITMHLESHILSKQKASRVAILILSSIATLLTSANFVNERATKDSHQPNKNIWMNILTVVITFLTTLVSGYVQIEGAKWKEQLEVIKQYQKGASDLMDTYDENLTVALNDRLPFTEFQKTIKSQWSVMPDRLDFSPGQRNAAVASIKANDLTVWKRGFIFFEMKESSCWRHCCSSVTLGEPVGDAYDYALMRFSGEDMGEFTTTPDTFKADKKEAKDALHKMAKMSGESVVAYMDEV